MWYKISNIEQIDSPAIVIFSAKIAENIKKAIQIAGDVNKLRPHVKTNKMAEVCRMMMAAGISKFKCATIAEAEMLGLIEAPDVLLACQPVGPKITRFLDLVKAYPETRFSCLADNAGNASAINQLCLKNNIIQDIYIDLNIGMNRTGILPAKAFELATHLQSFNHLRIAGLHGYDGHIHDTNPIQRKQAADLSCSLAEEARRKIQPLLPYPLKLVMGGTPTFPLHAHRTDCECSPGTFVFWDWGYKHLFPDMPFEYAALVISRIISIIDEHHICLDLGYKSVAAESPLPRVHFLNAPEAIPVSQSEEHIVLEVPDSSIYSVGDVFYGVPVHICPTVALYENVFVIENGEMTGTWNVIARNRYIIN
jgi:D-serine deaminase-like pyridoxal phosphate-dependent protein